MNFPWSRRPDIDEELRTHLQMAIQDRIARGESPDDAGRNARREFGNEMLVLETTRDMWGWLSIERSVQDLRYVLRQLRRNAGFTAVAVLTLALGLGATVAVFAIVNSVLLQPLSFKDPERLFTVLNLPPPGVANRYWMINPRHFHEWREHCRSCEGVAAAESASFTLTGRGEPERLPGLRVSYNFFRTLGVQPTLGRDFRREEELPNAFRQLLIADSLWRSRFGADPGIIGKTAQINDEPFVIVGILPSDLRLPIGNQWGMDNAAPVAPVMFRPLGLDVSQARGTGNNNFITVVRLKSGVQAPQAASEFSSLISDFVRQFKIQLRPTLLSLHGTMVRDSRVGLWLLLGIAGAVLLIVCLNVGNLMLVRAASRDREVGIRMAVGATRSQLMGLLLTEALVLVVLGFGLGVGLAYAALKGFVASAPAALPRVGEIHMGIGVFLFALAAAAVSMMICGVLPAWRLAHTDLQESLKSGSLNITAHGRKLRFREVMVGVEVALSTVLLLVGGLLIASFLRVLGAPSGIVMDQVLTQDVSLVGKYLDPDNRIRFIDEALTQLAAIPGVHSVGVTNQVPLRGEGWVCELRDMGMPDRPAVGVANFRFVNPSYWETLGIPLKAGRLFESAERSRGVAVLSERAAQALWPGESALGKRVGSCGGDQEQRAFEVVGVVGDVRASLEKDAPLTVYHTYTMTNMVRHFFVVRTQADPVATAAAMRLVFRSMDPNLPVPQPATMPQIFDEALAGRRFQMSLAVAFAGIGLLLAAVGIYGVISFTVARRTSEIGIRLALGARPPQVASMVILQGMIPVFAGLGSGLAFSLLMGRFIATQLYGISPYDPRTVAAVAALLLAAAVFACWIPARRATRIDPLTALRFD